MRWPRNNKLLTEIYMKTESQSRKSLNELEINQEIIENSEIKFGPRTRHTYTRDPKHLLFSLSRYKFVSKMFSGYKRVLEIGCGDAFGTALVAQTVGEITATDLDYKFINEIKKTHAFADQINFIAKDFINDSLQADFDGAFCLDVLEHIQKDFEEDFLTNVSNSLSENGDLIIGMPSLESQRYASDFSKQGHVNCKTASELRGLMLNYFAKVFIFSMNDEVLHTGFAPMSHYIFALCVSKVSKR